MSYFRDCVFFCVLSKLETINLFRDLIRKALINRYIIGVLWWRSATGLAIDEFKGTVRANKTGNMTLVNKLPRQGSTEHKYIGEPNNTERGILTCFPSRNSRSWFYSDNATGSGSPYEFLFRFSFLVVTSPNNSQRKRVASIARIKYGGQIERRYNFNYVGNVLCNMHHLDEICCAYSCRGQICVKIYYFKNIKIAARKHNWSNWSNCTVKYTGAKLCRYPTNEKECCGSHSQFSIETSVLLLTFRLKFLSWVSNHFLDFSYSSCCSCSEFWELFKSKSPHNVTFHGPQSCRWEICYFRIQKIASSVHVLRARHQCLPTNEWRARKIENTQQPAVVARTLELLAHVSCSETEIF